MATAASPYASYDDKNKPLTPTYTPTDYSKVTTPAASTYKPYDYASLITQASKAPATYAQTDYTKSMGLADKNNTQLTAPTNTVNYADALNQINTAKNTYSDATYQDPNMVGQITNDIVKALDPVTRQQNAQINSQYNASNRAMQDALAAKGLLRSGQFGNQMTTLEQGRNSELANAKASTISSALSQALPFAQLSLDERAQLQAQQSNAATQYADLLNQQTQHQMDVANYNALQNQNQFANTLATQQSQGQENQFGATFAADQTQNQYANLLAASQAAAGEGQYGQQFNADQTQNQYANALALMKAQEDTNQFGATYGQTNYQSALDEAFRQAEMAQQGGQFDQTLAFNQVGQNNTKDYNNAMLTGKAIAKDAGGNTLLDAAGNPIYQNTLSAQQMAMDELFRRDQLTQEGSQFDQTLEQNASQFDQSLRFDKAKEATRAKEFVKTFGQDQLNTLLGFEVDLGNPDREFTLEGGTKKTVGKLVKEALDNINFQGGD